MKVLLIGDSKSNWFKLYIDKVFSNIDCDLTILLDNDSMSNYDNINLTIKYYDKGNSMISKIPFLRVVSYAHSTFRNNMWDGYDIIVCMFVNMRDVLLAYKLKKENTKVFLYYAGSDLLRTKKSYIKLYYRLLKNNVLNVFGSYTLQTYFKNNISNILNTQVIRFGDSVFDEIDNLHKAKRNETHVVNFCLGYNASPNQHHIEMINCFANLEANFKRNIKLFIPMTYGYNEEYFYRVLRVLNDSKLDYTILTEYLDSVGMAAFWNKIDYMVNAQSTDSLSASLLEAAYAGCILINGAWLTYPEYEHFKIRTLNFDSFDKLSNILKGVISNKISINTEIDRASIKSTMSWEKSKQDWLDAIGEEK